MVMGHGFHLAVIQQECGFHQSLAITGRAGTDDPGAAGKLGINILYGPDRGL